MSDPLFSALTSAIHICFHAADWFRAAPRCPACVCGERCEAQEALTTALLFAQDQCKTSAPRTKDPDHSPGSSWSFLFWLGFVCGIVVSLVCLIALRLFVRVLSRDRPEPPNVTFLRRAAQGAIADGEPANPATLRQLGLVR